MYNHEYKLDKDKTKLFIDFINKTKIEDITDTINEDYFKPLITDSGGYYVTLINDYDVVEAGWNGDEDIDLIKSIYLAISICDENAAGFIE